jgi:hypothetical protein
VNSLNRKAKEFESFSKKREREEVKSRAIDHMRCMANETERRKDGKIERVVSGLMLKKKEQ